MEKSDGELGCKMRYFATYFEPLVFSFSSSFGRFSTDGTESTFIIRTTFDETRIVEVEGISRFVPASFGRRLHEGETS